MEIGLQRNAFIFKFYFTACIRKSIITPCKILKIKISNANVKVTSGVSCVRS